MELWLLVEAGEISARNKARVCSVVNVWTHFVRSGKGSAVVEDF